MGSLPDGCGFFKKKFRLMCQVGEKCSNCLQRSTMFGCVWSQSSWCASAPVSSLLIYSLNTVNPLAATRHNCLLFFFHLFFFCWNLTFAKVCAETQKQLTLFPDSKLGLFHTLLLSLFTHEQIQGWRALLTTSNLNFSDLYFSARSLEGQCCRLNYPGTSGVLRC